MTPRVIAAESEVVWADMRWRRCADGSSAMGSSHESHPGCLESDEYSANLPPLYDVARARFGRIGVTL